MNDFRQKVDTIWTKINQTNFVWTLTILLDDYTNYYRNEYPGLSV